MRGRLADAARVTAAFLYGVLLGVLWEIASMSVLLLAALVEYYLGTLVMILIFVGSALLSFHMALRADLLRPLLSILIFRLSAQIAMTIGTGSLILTTIVSDTPMCSSSRLRTSGWRAPVVALLKRSVPRRWLRRVVGVDPPYGPPFLRILAAVLSREWFAWIPDVGLPSILTLPGTITFRPDAPLTRASPAGPAHDGSLGLPPFSALLPTEPAEITGVYTYACRDVVHRDFYYIFRYQKALWMRPASLSLLYGLVSLFVKMLLMHAYASLFMLLSQSNCREAFAAELRRRTDRVHRWLWPRPPVRLIPIEPGDVCAFCHEELMRPAPDAADVDGGARDNGRPASDVPGEAVAAAAASAADGSPLARVRGIFLSLIGRAAAGGDPTQRANGDDAILHCRWGCGRAVHRECADAWGRNACVFCAAPMH